MKIGLLQFELYIDDAASLKDKRRIVKSLKDRLHREHLVSVAEVGDQEIWNRATIGVAAVSGDGAYLRAMLESIVRKAASLGDARLGTYDMDVVDATDLAGDLAEDGTPLWTESERRGASQS